MSPPHVIYFKASHWPSECGRINQAAECWQDLTGSRPLVGYHQVNHQVNHQFNHQVNHKVNHKVNQIKIITVWVLLSALVNRIGVSRLRDFLNCVSKYEHVFISLKVT